MKVINNSRKIIGIVGEPLLPNQDLTLEEGLEKHPTIQEYLKKGILIDADKTSNTPVAGGIDAAEREKIAAEAIEKYKAEQAAEEAKENEIKAVKAMRKDDLLKKAVAMGIEVKDEDTAEDIRTQILNAIGQ